MADTKRRDFVKSLAAVPLAMGGLASAAVEPGAAGPAASRAGQFDVVVAGAGHNSLICAAYLAKAGHRVLVLEAQSGIGGGTQTAELVAPGFKMDVCSSAHVGIARNPLVTRNELKLADFGYELFSPDVALHCPFADGASITVFAKDMDRSAATIARFSKKDAETFKRLYAARAALASVPVAERGKTRDGVFFQRLAALTGHAAARQVWESPYLQAASLSSGKFAGVPGSDPGTGAQALTLLDMLAGRPMPRGGSGMLATALAGVIEKHGGVILTGKAVSRFIVEGGRCIGVECRDGARYRAEKAVVSTLHPKQLVEMVPREYWPDAFIDDVGLMQPESGMFAFHFTLSEPPRYRAHDGEVDSPEAAIMQRPESIFMVNLDQARGEPTLDDLPLQVVHPSVFDKSRVPPGKSAVKIEGTVPYALRGGPQAWDAIKEQVADRLLRVYLGHTVNLTPQKVLGKALMSPLDLERKNPAMWRGGVHHLDRRWGISAPYRMPIAGLYQTGASTEGGGGVSGQPGRAAAALILQDFGGSLEQVVAG